MKFVTNSISTKSKVPTLSDIMKAAQTKAAMATKTETEAVVKTASVAAPLEAQVEVEIVKEAGKGDFGGKKAPPFGKGGKPVEDKEKVVDSNPKKDSVKPAKKKASADGSSDEGESSGQLKDEPRHQVGESTDEKPGDLDTMKEDGTGSKGGKGKNDKEGESSGQLKDEPRNPKGESTGEKPGDLDTEKDKKAASASQFIKIANLSGEQKTFLRKEWSKWWPKKFIDALLADR